MLLAYEGCRDADERGVCSSGPAQCGRVTVFPFSHVLEETSIFWRKCWSPNLQSKNVCSVPAISSASLTSLLDLQHESLCYHLHTESPQPRASHLRLPAVGAFLPSMLCVPGAQLISWQARVAQELQQEGGDGASSIPLEHSEECTREASSEPQLLFSKPRRWLGATRTLSAAFSKLRSQRALKFRRHGDRGVPRANCSGAACPQWLCPDAPVSRLSVALAARSPGSPLAGPPRRGSRCAARPLRPPAVCARGRSGAAGQREPQSAPARRPAGMLRYSSGLTVTATTPRRTAGDGGRARRKVRGAAERGGRRGGPAGRAVGRCDPSRSDCRRSAFGLA